MKKFWKFLLRSDLPNTVLRGLQFSTFGLGDSSYPIYNAASRRLHGRLQSLGAQELIVGGLGDDQHSQGIEGGLVPWLEQLFPALTRAFPSDLGVSESFLPFPQYHVNIHQDTNQTDTDCVKEQAGDIPYYTQYVTELGSFNGITPKPLKVQSNDRITAASHFQDSRCIHFETTLLSEEERAYKPGDVLCIIPPVPRILVDTMLQLYKQDRDAVIEVQCRSQGSRLIPKFVRAWELFTWYVDIHSTATRGLFTVMAQLATDPTEKERLTDLVSLEYADVLHNYCGRERRSVCEVFFDFPSALLPLSWLLEFVPCVRPRRYSIASSSEYMKSSYRGSMDVYTDTKSCSNQACIIIGLQNYVTPYRRQKVGLCSAYQDGLLSTKSNGRQVPGFTLGEQPVSIDTHIDVGEEYIWGWIETGSFQLEKIPGPKVLVGPGTGIAPILAYVQSLLLPKLVDAAADVNIPKEMDWSSISTKSSNILHPQNEVLVFYGCRGYNQDMYFPNQFHTAVKYHAIEEYHCVFSRTKVLDQDHNNTIDTEYMKDNYVQHRMQRKEPSRRIYELLIEKEGCLIIAGSGGKMPASIKATILAIIEHYGKHTTEEAQLVLDNMIKQGRYLLECW